ASNSAPRSARILDSARSRSLPDDSRPCANSRARPGALLESSATFAVGSSTERDLSTHDFFRGFIVHRRFVVLARAALGRLEQSERRAGSTKGELHRPKGRPSAGAHRALTELGAESAAHPKRCG